MKWIPHSNNPGVKPVLNPEGLCNFLPFNHNNVEVVVLRPELSQGNIT